MDETVYTSPEWRALPRDSCVVSLLFGEVVGECAGVIDRHHVDRLSDRTVPVCHRHHPKLEAALRYLRDPLKSWKRCPHRPGTHHYPQGKEACERALNRDLLRAA